MSAISVESTEIERPHVLFVDNFDSFTYNLVEYTSAFADTSVVTNTATLDEIREANPDAIVISPGPGHPKNERDVGISTAVLTELAPTIPTLGVCLGLEAAIFAYGGTVGRAPQPVHGKAFPVEHDGQGVFAGLDDGFQAGRYHSLVATEVPDCFDVSASTTVPAEDADSDETTDLVMGIRHESHPLSAVQFHPESVLTGVGHDIIENFVAGVSGQ